MDTHQPDTPASEVPRNALGIPHGTYQRPDYWTTTRIKALRKAARAAGMCVAMTPGGPEITDPVSRENLCLPDPRAAGQALARLAATRPGGEAPARPSAPAHGAPRDLFG